MQGYFENCKCGIILLFKTVIPYWSLQIFLLRLLTLQYYSIFTQDTQPTTTSEVNLRLCLTSIIKSSQRKCSVKKVFLKIFQISQENTRVGIFFLIKIQAFGSYRISMMVFMVLHKHKKIRVILLRRNIPSWHFLLESHHWKYQNNMFKVNHKDSRTTSLIGVDFVNCFGVFTVDFEQVKDSWV